VKSTRKKKTVLTTHEQIGRWLAEERRLEDAARKKNRKRVKA
jgi:hypothetical protein